jgi:hypothetical protein
VLDIFSVGAGASGSVVASRLSEDKDVSVLLLEAGSDGSYFTSIPGLQGLFYGGPFDWQFEPEEQLYSCLGYDKRVSENHEFSCRHPSSFQLGETPLCDKWMIAGFVWYIRPITNFHLHVLYSCS